ncbi:cytochrome P450 CYP72A219-like, partial [Momordica charantia]|uniref:Cytochrome P450 CYP72A219-like n=1 Tax=Momordica charantia TaxID=3673 RepID=A0A6J1DZU2_MOMCH
METMMSVVWIWVVVLVGLLWGWSVVNWVWVRPKKLENLLRRQGFAGNSYRIFYGDLKDRSALSERANSKPMNFSHHIAPRIIPSEYQTIQNYGKNSFTWFGPYPRVHIMEPEKLKDIFSLIDDVPKPNLNPMIKLLLEGIVSYQGAKWAKHKKIIAPAFHFLKLKDMVPTFFNTCNEMVSQWERLVSKDGSCELDVMPYLHNLTADIISRTACGSSYKEGQMIFQLLKELIELVTKSASGFYIPGW